MPFGHYQKLINRAYYRMKSGEDLFGAGGGGRKGDFVTMASHDSRIGHALAEEAHKSLRRAAKVPRRIRICELGVGNGNLAATFLDRFKELDNTHNTEFYKRLDYVLGDYSEAILKDVRKSPQIEAHSNAGVTTFVNLSADAMPFRNGSLFRMISHELWDDLGTEILVKRGDKVKKVHMMPILRTGTKIRDKNGVEVVPEEFKKDFRANDPKKLERYAPSVLKGLKMSPTESDVAWENIPYSNIVKKQLKGVKEGVFMMVNTGMIRNLEAAKRALMPRRGIYHAFDYGYWSEDEVMNGISRGGGRETKVSPYKGFGGQVTSAVNLPLGKRIAEHLGFKRVAIGAESEFVSKHLGEGVISIGHLVRFHPELLEEKTGTFEYLIKDMMMGIDTSGAFEGMKRKGKPKIIHPSFYVTRNEVDRVMGTLYGKGFKKESIDSAFKVPDRRYVHMELRA